MSPKVSEKTFCVGPWTEVRISADGSLNFCHAADRSNIPDNEYVQTMSVDQYFDCSESVTQARNQILQGRTVDACSNCYHNDQLGVISFRQRRNLQYAIFPNKDFEPSVIQSNFWDAIAANNFKPRFYHVSLSNLCNMSCLMCNPRDSSLFAATKQRVKNTIPILPTLTDWTQDTAWDKFCEHILNNQHIVCIHVMGGEPMYHKKFKSSKDQSTKRPQ